jgi:hypothetical protein
MHDDIIARVEQIAASQWQATEGQEPTEPAPPSFEAAEDEISEVMTAARRVLTKEFGGAASVDPLKIMRGDSNNCVVYFIIGMIKVGRCECVGHLMLCRESKDVPLVSMNQDTIMKVDARHNDDDEISAQVMGAILAQVARLNEAPVSILYPKEPAPQTEEINTVASCHMEAYVEKKLSLLGRVKAWLRRRV